MEHLALEIERIVHGGRALASAPDGRRVLVAGAIPGERVLVAAERKRGVWMGDVLQVIEGSPDRVEGPEHPGLDMGHVAYERQLELKRDVVLDGWRRAHQGEAPALDLAGVVPSPEVWGYRATIQPAVADRERGDDVRLGYRRMGSHEVVPLADDPTANAACRRGWHAALGVALPRGVREVVLRGNDDGEVLVALVAETATKDLLAVAHDLVRAGAHGVVGAPYDPRGRFRGGAERLAGARSIRQPYGDVTLTLTATSFAQPNPGAAHGLYRTLAEWAPSARHALDLFAGSGVIGMHLAPRCERVTALEIDRGSVDRGRRDADEAGIVGFEIFRSDVRDLKVADDVDLVAVDPPRAGLSAGVRDALHASRAQHLLYVSCDVATWSRDVADLTRRGWHVERVRAFDFQPHTHHVELLSSLVRGADDVRASRRPSAAPRGDG
ncbi:MAG: class I SAM-dependent RNA methyltransferase [Trueperaceae bacterium]|nr:class I SAM-dependent RNA methyltransferase [Trueperaceae bacterium]